MIRTGKMRHRIRIEVQGTAHDSSGEQAQTWTTFATRWASVQRAQGMEVQASAQRTGRIPVVFGIRYLDGVHPGMRVVFRGRVHNITSAVDQEGLTEELLLYTDEEGAAE